MREEDHLVDVVEKIEGPHPTVTRCSSRADRSPPASAPLCARFGPAPPAHGGVIHGHARRSGCVCSAARASRLRLRVAPGSVQPAAPPVLRSAAHTQPPLWAWPTERFTRAGGLVPRGGARSATADGLLHRRARPRVAVGCGIRSSPVLWAHKGGSEVQTASGARAAATCPRVSGSHSGCEPFARYTPPSSSRPQAPEAAKGEAVSRRFRRGVLRRQGHLPSLLQVSEGLAGCPNDTRLRGCAPPPRPCRTIWRGTPGPP